MLIRKASLSVITAHAVNGSQRDALSSMFVLFIAFGCQLSFMPFTNDDANYAESLSIGATCLVLLIGLAYQTVILTAPDGLEVGDIDSVQRLCNEGVGLEYSTSLQTEDYEEQCRFLMLMNWSLCKLRTANFCTAELTLAQG